MVGDGGGASSGCLVGITESRDAGGGGLVVDCTGSFSGRWCGRGRGGGVGVDTTVSRSGCRGGVVRLAGDSLPKRCRGAGAGRRVAVESWLGKVVEGCGGHGLIVGVVAVGVEGQSVRVAGWIRGGGSGGEVDVPVCWSGRGERG
ncbi:hypothetical protein [Nocardia beijingensis]|uniref:Uncharacterized protein n=1 Tax=Nocardia beijingensis TaxID=95162 RepID=A0ABW7WPR5_9NOCA